MAVTPLGLGRGGGGGGGGGGAAAIGGEVAVAPCAANGAISSASTAATRRTVCKPTNAYPTHGEVGKGLQL